MAKTATIIGLKGGSWCSIAIGTSADMRKKFKVESFPGFDRVQYLDTSGTSRRKKGAKAPPKKTSKAKTKEE